MDLYLYVYIFIAKTVLDMYGDVEANRIKYNKAFQENYVKSIRKNLSNVSILNVNKKYIINRHYPCQESTDLINLYHLSNLISKS